MPKKIVHLHTILLIVLLSVSLLGCSLGAKSVKSGINSLYVELWTNNGCPPLGTTVTLRATLTNGGSNTEILELETQPVLDLIVGNPDTSQARWSAGKPLSSDLTRLKLKPGESKSIEMQWTVKEPGTFVSAQLIPNTQSIQHPVSASLVLGAYCTNFIGP